MTRRTPPVLAPALFALLGLATLYLPSIQAQEAGQPVPLPSPSLDGLEDAVSEQLASHRSQIEARLAEEELTDTERAAAWGHMARLYHAYGLGEAAETCYRQARRFGPGGFDWHHGLGMLLQERGDFAGAEEAYLAALEVDSVSVASMVYLSEIELARGRNIEAAAWAQRALDVQAELPSAQAALGRARMEQREYAEAASLFEAALAKVPQATRLHYPLALAYRSLGDLDRARQHLDQVGEVGIRAPDPLLRMLTDLKTGEIAHILRGKQAFQAGQFEQAAAAFAKAVDAAPESAKARVDLAAALSQLGDLAGAENQLRRAIELDAENQVAAYNLGVLLRFDGRLDEARGHLDRAIELAPGDVAARFERVTVLRQLGQGVEALAELTTMQQAGTTGEDLELQTAATLIDLGRFSEAVDRLETAHATAPESGRIAHALARVLAACPIAELRDGARALDLAGRVFEAQRTVPHALTVALALAETGQCELAAQWQQQAIDGVPENDTQRRRILAVDLERYQAGAPCRPPIAAAAARP